MNCFRQGHRFSRITFLFVAGALIVSSLTSCSHVTEGKNAGIPAGSQPDSHKKMLRILSDEQAKMFNRGNRYSAEAKLLYCDSIIASARDVTQQLNAKFAKAAVLLEYGDEAQSVALYEELFKLVGKNPQVRKNLMLMTGTAYMRLAERSNCVSGHTSDACIMPIQGNGVHQDKTPARKAINIFQTVLQEDATDMDALWLLNIAYMTVGEYPQSVPKAWLIPGLDAPGYEVQPFIDMATDLKLAVNNRAGGCIVDDFNNDGYLDIVTSAWGLDDPMHYFKNNGDGTFTDVSKESGLSSITGGLNMTQTDYNNDGWTDIFVLRGGWQGALGFGNQPNSLLKNNGDGTFSDVTTDAGLLSFHPTQTATWNDFNRDGWLDLFIGNESATSEDLHACEFYLNNRNGTFTNVAEAAGINIQAFIKGVASGDYDNDGWPDLFFSSMNGEKLLLRNKGVQNGQVVFENMTEKAGFAKEIFRTFPTWFWDYDNDGWLDIFVCNYEFERPLSYYSAREALHPSSDFAGKPFIYRNNHNGTFTNVTSRMDINKTCFSMGANFGDIDNDGFLDMYLATGNPSYMSLVPNKLFKNLGGRKFADVTVSSRTGNLQKGHGVAFADLDNDGDEDIYVDMGGAYRGDAYPAAFYMNPGQGTNNWICIKLEGTQSNRAAIGAKVTLKFRENGQQRMVYREVNSGGSFGCSPLRREIGVGKAEVIDEIAVQWPVSGKTQVFKNVRPEQFIHIKEDQNDYEVLALNKLVFKKADGTIPMCVPVQ